MEINTKLKALRKQKGISQDEAAHCLGVSLSSYQKYEREKNSVTPSLEALLKLADFYGVTTDYLLDRNTEGNPFAEYDLDETEQHFFTNFLKLPPPVRKIILDTFSSILSQAYFTVKKNDDEEYKIDIDSMLFGKNNNE